jgi:hypothetical protein
MSFIEKVPADPAFCEFDCQMSPCPPDCPQRSGTHAPTWRTRCGGARTRCADADTLEDASLIFFDREPETFNFQSRTPETANVSHHHIVATNWVCVILLALTALGALYGAGVFDWIWQRGPNPLCP